MEKEICIVGAGAIGSALGCALAQSTLFSSILLIDSAPKVDFVNTPIPNPKVSLLSPTTHRFLKSIGSWDKLDLNRKGELNGVKLWDYYGSGYINYEGARAWVLENSALENASTTRFQELEGTEFLQSTSLNNIKNTSSHIELELSDGRKVKTSLLIGADGKDSKVRELSHINTWEWKQDTLGLVFVVKTEGPCREAFMRFLQTGPVMLLPLWDDYMSVMWNLPTNITHRMTTLTKDQLLDELNEALKHPPKIKNFWGDAKVNPPRLSEIVSDVEVHPHTIKQAKSFVADKTALVGDAAHTLYPLLGQGTNPSMYDAINLAAAIIENAKLGKSISSEDYLNNYNRKAYCYNATAAYFEQTLKFAYSDISLLHYFRNFGFGFMNLLGPLKSFSISVANGDYVVPKQWPWVDSIPKDDEPFIGSK